MERLTQYTGDGENYDLINPIDTPYEYGKINLRALVNKLGKYEDAEEEGSSLRLPISEDTPVYSIEYCCGKNKSNQSRMRLRGFCEKCSDKAYHIRESIAKHYSICEINRSVFLAREEAEAKLKEMEGADGR